MKVCKYKKNSNEPCKDCPRLMSALYRCGLLQEYLKETQDFLQKNKKINNNNDEA